MSHHEKEGNKKMPHQGITLIYNPIPTSLCPLISHFMSICRCYEVLSLLNAFISLTMHS